MKTLVLTAVLANLLAISGQETQPRWAVLNHTAGQQIKNKDYAGLRATLEELAPLMPGNPRILYNKAASDAVLGHRDRALAELHQLADAGLIYELNADDDFKSLTNLPEFQAILLQMKRNREPVKASDSEESIAERDSLPEDVTYDPRKHTFLISSVTESKIAHLNGDMFARAPWPVMALRIDPKRRILWATTAWLPHCARCRAEDKDKTALLEYQLDSGALLGRFDSPVAGMFGDMTIGRGGEIYVSEGIYGAVFRFADGSFERLDAPGEFPSPQTPALSEDERTLYVPDYARGIGALDLKTHEVKWLQPADGVTLSGIDGLYVYHQWFIAIQNGTNPARVIQFSLDLKRQKIFEANTPGLGEPTHGTVVKQFFYFLANTGWGEYGDDGKKKTGSQPVASTLRKIDLSKTGLR